MGVKPPKRKIKDAESDEQQKEMSSGEQAPGKKRRKEDDLPPPMPSSLARPKSKSKSKSKPKSRVKSPTPIENPHENSVEPQRIGILGFPVTQEPIPPPQKPIKSLQIKNTVELLEHAVEDDGRGLRVKVGEGIKTETLVFQPTTSIGPRDWPEIRFGEHGAMPRWTLKESKRGIPNGRDLYIDLIQTHRDRTNIIGVDKYTHPYSGDWKNGLGTLEWKFEPGPSVKWKGLTEAQLYEYAYLCLMDALRDYQSRETIRSKIREKRFRSVRNVQDPLPPPPAPPKVTHFGANPGITEWPKMPPPVHGAYTRFFNDYWRPTMGIHTRPGGGLRVEATGPEGASDDHFLTARMFHHLKGTLGPVPGKISESHDPKASLTPVESVVSSEVSEPRKSSLSKEWDPEKATGEAKQLRAGGVVGMIQQVLNKPRTLANRGLPAVQNSSSTSTTTTATTTTTDSSLPSSSANSGKSLKTKPKPSHKDMIMLSDEIDSERAYRKKCQQICKDPLKRQKYFPEPKAVRRVRTWAGSSIPLARKEAWEAAELLPTIPQLERPFRIFKTSQKSRQSWDMVEW